MRWPHRRSHEHKAQQVVLWGPMGVQWGAKVLQLHKDLEAAGQQVDRLIFYAHELLKSSPHRDPDDPDIWQPTAHLHLLHIIGDHIDSLRSWLASNPPELLVLMRRRMGVNAYSEALGRAMRAGITCPTVEADEQDPSSLLASRVLTALGEQQALSAATHLNQSLSHLPAAGRPKPRL